MIYFSLFLCIVLIGFLVAPSKQNYKKWKYRNIHHLLKWWKKRGWNIPAWVNEVFIFQCWMVLFLGSIVLLLCSYCFCVGTITKLEKPRSGSGAVWEDVELVWEDEGGNTKKEQLQIEVKEQQIEQEVVEKYFAEIKDILKEEILGENESLEFVNKPLSLPEKMEQYQAEITWDSDSPWILNWEGELGQEIPQEGALVCLTATITIQNREDSFNIEVTVFPAEYDWLEDLKQEVNEIESESAWLELPEEWNGIEIVWKKNNSNVLVFITLLVLTSPILMFFKRKQEIEEREKRERQQMLQDYPEIISKLMLLLSTGMSLRRAIEKIVSDYRIYGKNEEKRKAYELLADICREINCGLTEKQAYERMGAQCDVLQYRTLSALLVQHLQKGNMGMEQMLTEEVRRAQELRQQQAKILGEQASAKLLFPMMLMLLDVFIVLIVPAWISFSI